MKFSFLFSPVLIIIFSQVLISSSKNITDWEFCEAGKHVWYPATVPGCVHTDLLANHLIDDPFYRDNEEKLQWIGKTDWLYRAKFSIDQKILSRENVELIFKGLDTYTSIYLNGRFLLTTDNMFREWQVDCKRLLKPGNNLLQIQFHSPINKILPLMKQLAYQLPASNDRGEKTSPYTRKAPYHFGWDWGPRFVTCGIWQPVFLNAWDTARIADLFIEIREITGNRADLVAHLEIEATRNVAVQLMLEDSENSFSAIKRTLELKPGLNAARINFTIKNPQLWWPNGLGRQKLYTIAASVIYKQTKIDNFTRRIGLRTLELQRQKDRWGESFTFVVNGVPLFAKGGNWIPADNFLPRVTEDRYRRLLKSCAAANMNMLRVWGGGIYENDIFYDLCDELGILVWQDFMFACSMYPGDDAFLRNVEQEAIYQVKRLRNHPALALWCGNNEIEIAWFHWGWKERLPQKLWGDYIKLFHELLPRICARFDATRTYWPSSPGSNLKADSNSQQMGDMHYWGVWHGAEPFKNYEQQFPRFMSEYGFQSFPLMKTINSFTIREDHDIESAVMQVHQKHPRGNQLIREYMLRHFPPPQDFETFLFYSQILQAEGIKIAAEHLRRNRPRCMGSLYWQINDCWPVASWSSIDYFGRWKALHYYARKFYSPILVSPTEEQGMLNIYIVSDLIKSRRAKLTVTLMNFEGKIIRQHSTDVDITPTSSNIYYRLSLEEWLQKQNRSSVFLHCAVLEGQNKLSENFYFFKPIKELALPLTKIKYRVTPGRRGFKITLSSDKFARNVYLSCDEFEGFFTDNFFHLLPGKEYTVEFLPDKPVAKNKFEDNFRVHYLINK